ncbi:MAG: tRNA (adenosine(37)-N6)-threonylcarbamoyltransferase complex transferase subunit TsaD [Candidatus Sericytochromatia bacterium]
MIILGIESSCDETSVSLVKDGKEIICNLVASQIDIHKKYGGVVPEVASRQHVLVINSLLEELFNNYNITKDDIDAIAVTYAPGLQGSLIIGLITAKTLAWLWNKKIIPVNHLEGHMYSPFLEKEIKPPFLTLLVSGGHTELIIFEDHGKYSLLGKTRDDAVGEAFDKVARLLNLPYPGGPYIDKKAQNGNPEKFNFPRALHNSYDFSFSGLKTAVLYTIRDMEKENLEIPEADLCASFSEAIADTLVKKALKACKEFKLNKIVISGGVAANSTIRKKMTEECAKRKIEFFCPPIKLCTDNAAMIACAGYYKFIRDDYDKNWLEIEAQSRLKPY